MKRQLQSKLYWFYRIGWQGRFVTRQSVSPLGWLFLAAAPVSFVLAVMYPRRPLFFLLALLFCLLFFSIVHVFIRHAKLKVKRELSSFATAGEPLEYTVSCSNLGAMSVSNVLLVDYGPTPYPDKMLFLNSVEPGENLRNSFDRLFVAYRWMWMVKLRIMVKSSVQVAGKFKAGEQRQLRMRLTPTRRGVISLERMYALLPDAIGLFQRMVKVEQESDTLIVLPKRYRIKDLQFSGQSRNQLGGDAAASTSGQSGEFIGLREYRPGDPIRHIHWPSWAKSGKPIVKEFEEVFFPRYGLVLDTAVTAELHAVFEEAVSIAASFACAVDTRQSLLDLMFVQQKAQVHTIGRGVAKVESMLEVLAGIEMDSEPDWEGLSSRVLRHLEDLSTCIIVLCDWCPERQQMLLRWAQSGVQLKVLLVCEDHSAMQKKVTGAAVPITYIEQGDVERGLEQLCD